MSEIPIPFILRGEPAGEREPCTCGEFAIWYVDLAGVDAASDHVVCKCGHSTREHVATVGRCLGEVEARS